MKKILYVIASPRGEASKSVALAQAHIEARKRQDPDIEIIKIDLWEANLPEFEGKSAAAKMTFFGDGEMNEERQTVWDEMVNLANDFNAAEEYVFAIPMWNGGIPYKLKQYIDILTQPGLLFGFDPEKGYFGLLQNKKATVFYTSGVFSPGADPKYGSDYHSTYMDWWLNLIGITEVNNVRFQPTLLTEHPEKGFQEAMEVATAV